MSDNEVAALLAEAEIERLLADATVRQALLALSRMPADRQRLVIEALMDYAGGGCR